VFELSDVRRAELIEDWAKRLVARGLGPLAVFLLEAHKPLGGIGANAVLAFQPVLDNLLPVHSAEVAAFINRPENIEQLILRVEALADERAAAAQAEREHAKAVRRRARRLRKLRGAREPGTD
jgi:hypothetical protein